ncbi:glycosyltransferase family 4 protein [Methanomethylovorans sp.]|uniref:glycosyltransferase family 4 protein n=1 Tax=Methanomethylovorans sp. TaxID=2758717 RepID=UPI000ABCBE78|nr:glycosyltransferase family 4 protein [Methanomethylovorans sp.]
MKIAFVVQRYGKDIVGGAEYFTRQVAERMRQYHEIEILTTCAAEYHFWKNEYPEGLDILNGVRIRRFMNAAKRNPNKHMKIQEAVYYSAHTANDEILWINEQGPNCPELVQYISHNRENYDCFVFFTFRYYPTYYGIKEAGSRSLIVPFAENDPALDLGTTKEIFENANGIVYCTPEEKKLIERKVGIGKEKASDIIGCGIEVPNDIRHTEMLKNMDYVLYIGRIEGSKGCYQLFEYYQRLLNESQDIPTLVLAGLDAIEIPKHDKIKYLGFISEDEKYSLLRDAQFLIMPSPYESLSLVTLEAMGCGTAVLVNGECDVLKGHCLRSNAGLWYQNYEEFRECFRFLCSNDMIKTKIGENGKRYVKNNYSWNVIERKYLELFSTFDHDQKQTSC